jgi:hypothetical protein
LLEIDNPEDEEIIVFYEINRKKNKISKNQRGEFEIGRTIYANEDKKTISVFAFNSNDDKFDFFTLATKEHFMENPLSYSNGKAFWNVEDTFLGDKNNDFLFTIESTNSHVEIERKNKNREIKDLSDLPDDIYNVQIKIKDKNIFFKEETYIFEGKLLVGKWEEIRFKNKRFVLLSANVYSARYEWILFTPKYFVDKLQFVQEEKNSYYLGRLCVVDKGGKTKVLNRMKNEEGDYDKINPVRIELGDHSTLGLVGSQGGDLFCDKKRKGI